jgi:hypothetical protein
MIIEVIIYAAKLNSEYSQRDQLQKVGHHYLHGYSIVCTYWYRYRYRHWHCSKTIDTPTTVYI